MHRKATDTPAISIDKLPHYLEHITSNNNLVLFIGDPHFRKDNVAQTERYADECVRIFEKCPPGTICLVAGDVLDSHGIIHQKPMQRAINFFYRLMNIGQVVVLVGNHDYITNQEYLSTNHWMYGMEKWPSRMKIVSKPIMFRNMVFMPYVPSGRMIEALDTTLGHNVWTNAHCVFAHQEVYGVVHGGVASTTSDRWFVNYPPLISGHIHTSQRISENVFYPGSVISHSFGESGDSEVYLIELLPQRQVSLQPITISVPRRKNIVLRFDEIIGDIESSVKKATPADELERIRIRIILSNTDSMSDPRMKQFLKKLPENVKHIPHFESIILKNQEIPASTRKVSFDENLIEALNNAEPAVREFVLFLLNG